MNDDTKKAIPLFELRKRHEATHVLKIGLMRYHLAGKMPNRFNQFFLKLFLGFEYELVK